MPCRLPTSNNGPVCVRARIVRAHKRVHAQAVTHMLLRVRGAHRKIVACYASDYDDDNDDGDAVCIHDNANVDVANEAAS